ncbi:deoxyguanosinetriphosphate triphosphohydrolase [Eubacterium multiforme]|uniref:Deoxyguanosinetriphosphate triphosphohydrolase-like protein n=1 Tax=Eubacterium multiforme TaxID=83339 RepID=A0ABT9UUW3_9FIRM|nr:deoxyguanosinetriphosphate triphosphohydrolase [Eubacterium multiforme]MDQ0150109.1 dGTPase [Eubacterium multiforme]
MNIREKIENFERLTLRKEGQYSFESLGRKHKENKKENIRTCFMVDRDRIIHSKAFRRLKDKTQVYIRTKGDHYRNRLTHTLEVSQIARTIGVGIGLNEYLIEAIALGHDLGHVAFAHNGEEVLNKFLKDGFKHNEQSVRVVERLEKDGKGLNLTKEVIDGILKHSGLSKDEKKGAITLEGRVVKYSDKIAYLNHDIDDSIRANLLREEDLPKEVTKVLGKTHSERIETLVLDFISESNKNLDNGIFKVSLSEEKDEAMRELRKFMFKNVYLGEILKVEREKAKFILESIIDFYMKNPEEMPLLYRKIVDEEGLSRGVADYIAGMSDDYCLNKFNEIYVPKLVIY